MFLAQHGYDPFEPPSKPVREESPNANEDDSNTLGNSAQPDEASTTVNDGVFPLDYNIPDYSELVYMGNVGEDNDILVQYHDNQDDEDHLIFDAQLRDYMHNIRSRIDKRSAQNAIEEERWWNDAEPYVQMALNQHRAQREDLHGCFEAAEKHPDLRCTCQSRCEIRKIILICVKAKEIEICTSLDLDILVQIQLFK